MKNYVNSNKLPNLQALELLCERQRIQAFLSQEQGDGVGNKHSLEANPQPAPGIRLTVLSTAFLSPDPLRRV